MNDQKQINPQFLPVGKETFLDLYEKEMKELKINNDILTWHLLILDNLIENFLPKHGLLLIYERN